MYPVSAENSAERSIGNGNGNREANANSLYDFAVVATGELYKKGSWFCLFVLASVATVVPPGPQTALGI